MHPFKYVHASIQAVHFKTVTVQMSIPKCQLYKTTELSTYMYILSLLSWNLITFLCSNAADKLYKY